MCLAQFSSMLLRSKPRIITKPWRSPLGGVVHQMLPRHHACGATNSSCYTGSVGKALGKCRTCTNNTVNVPLHTTQKHKIAERASGWRAEETRTSKPTRAEIATQRGHLCAHGNVGDKHNGEGCNLRSGRATINAKLCHSTNAASDWISPILRHTRAFVDSVWKSSESTKALQCTCEGFLRIPVLKPRLRRRPIPRTNSSGALTYAD